MDIKTHPTLLSGLLAYYKLDGNANDSHTNVLNGTAVGTPTWPTSATYCRLRQALQLNGTSQYISIPDNDLFEPTTGISVGGWFWIDSTGINGQPLVNKYYLGSPWTNKSWELYFNISANTLGATIVWGPTPGVDYWTVEKASLSALRNSWHHLAFTYDNSTLILYVDGFEAARRTGCSGNPLANATPVYIGSYWNQDNSTRTYAKGYYDEIAIATKAWTPAEVRDLYHTGYPLRYEEQYVDSLQGASIINLPQPVQGASSEVRALTRNLHPSQYAIDKTSWSFALARTLDDTAGVLAFPSLLRTNPDVNELTHQPHPIWPREAGVGSGFHRKGKRG